MKETTFKKIFSSFTTNNLELISNYESECNDTFEDNYESMFDMINKQSDNIAINIKDILRTALCNAISYHCNIQDSLNDLFTLVDDSSLNSYSINAYFNEVNDIYKRNNNDYDIEYCEENREKLIHMNLKSVISVAKKYQNLGLEFDDLIQAGNEGLCVSFDKYDPKRAKLRERMIERVQELDDVITLDELSEKLAEFMTYGNLMKKFKHDFTEQTYNKTDVIKWIKKNVFNAKFNSVANMWIRAYIINELNNNSRTVKKPKTEIDKDVQETGSYKKEVKLDIDAPMYGEDSRTLGDTLYLEDDNNTDLEVGEAQRYFKEGLNRLLCGVKPRDRAVFLKKFGIGLPRPMLPNEIANQEGLSVARVSQIFQTVEQQIQVNQAKYNIDISKLLEAAKVLR